MYSEFICTNTKDTWVTVILLQDYYIKMHTDSVTYVNANSRPSFYCSDFRCYNKDIQSVSQSVRQKQLRNAYYKNYS